jgi:uncharacterized membrane protein YgdD (TMEM256/DUF423 family)
MDRTFIAIGAFSALIAVASGAFGAHALRERLAADLLEIFETGARYQMYHALAMVAVGLALTRFTGGGQPWLTWSGWLFLIGTIFFAGSLYVLAFTGIRWLGAITPIGGLAFILGWAALAIGVLRD